MKKNGFDTNARSLVESELKYRLKSSHYRVLYDLFSQKGVTDKFTNYFFDTPDLKLREKRIAFRIRLIESERAIVTLKYPPAAKPANEVIKHLRVRQEAEEDIPVKTALKIITGEKPIGTLDNTLPLQVLLEQVRPKHIEKIGLLGSLSTVRTVAPLTPELTIELDRCELFKKKFYELEIETEKPVTADKAIQKLFDEYDIPYSPTTKSKLGRFIAEWKKENGS